MYASSGYHLVSIYNINEDCSPWCSQFIKFLLEATWIPANGLLVMFVEQVQLTEALTVFSDVKFRLLTNMPGMLQM